MKKLFIALMLFFSLVSTAYADLIPARVSDIPLGTLGVYQPSNSLKLYSKPDTKSNTLFNKAWNYMSVEASDYADTLFAVLIPKKELSFIYATDIDEDFVQVMFNKQKKLTGWAYKEDNFQFMPWITFYNMYGRKYGLKLLKGAPDSVLELHSNSSKESQAIAKLNRPKEIRFTAIQGNWALVTVLDIETAKTGYIQWRGENGELYLFPNIK